MLLKPGVMKNGEAEWAIICAGGVVAFSSFLFFALFLPSLFPSSLLPLLPLTHPYLTISV
jgi:hypothetical protein